MMQAVHHPYPNAWLETEKVLLRCPCKQDFTSFYTLPFRTVAKIAENENATR
jgi:hypothetical protein